MDTKNSSQMVNNLDVILQDLEPISLKQMDGVQLLDRTDTKFIFHSSRVWELLCYAQEYYQILQIGNERAFHYNTTYFDTADYMFFRQHMSGRTKRYKVRYRIYESTGASYLEVKCKTPQKRTVKWRILNRFTENKLDVPALGFLKDHIFEDALNINPVLNNNFERITLVGLETKERITIDYNISFRSEEGKELALPYLAIAELKREGFTNKSPFLDILRHMQIRRSSFSKYCIGNALLRPMIKTNILKASLLQLQKIEHDKSVYSFI